MDWKSCCIRPDNVDQWDPGIPDFKHMTEEELKEFDELIGKPAKERLERRRKEQQEKEKEVSPQ